MSVFSGSDSSLQGGEESGLGSSQPSFFFPRRLSLDWMTMPMISRMTKVRPARGLPRSNVFTRMDAPANDEMLISAQSKNMLMNIIPNIPPTMYMINSPRSMPKELASESNDVAPSKNPAAPIAMDCKAMARRAKRTPITSPTTMESPSDPCQKRVANSTPATNPAAATNSRNNFLPATSRPMPRMKLITNNMLTPFRLVSFS